MTDQDTEIVIEDDAGAMETSPAPEKPILTAEEGIEDLKRKLEAEQQARKDAEQARKDAERRAHEASAREVAAKTEVEDANLTLIKNTIETVKRDQVMARANWQAAMTSGDYEAAAVAQEAGQMAAARLMRLEEGKTAAENRPKPVAPQQVNPVEALASQLTPRSAAWVRAHPEYATDRRLYQKMIAAHNIAVADGVDADTDAYFESIEDTLRIRKPPVQQQDDPMAAAAQVTQRRSAPAAAPVTRGTMNGTKSNVIRLTADEREMASMMGMSEQDYAKNKAELIAAGRLRN